MTRQDIARPRDSTTTTAAVARNEKYRLLLLHKWTQPLAWAPFHVPADEHDQLAPFPTPESCAVIHSRQKVAVSNTGHKFPWLGGASLIHRLAHLSEWPTEPLKCCQISKCRSPGLGASGLCNQVGGGCPRCLRGRPRLHTSARTTASGQAVLGPSTFLCHLEDGAWNLATQKLTSAL